MSQALVRHFEQRLAEKGISGIQIEKVETRIGCIVTIVSFATVVTVVGAVYKFLVDYDSLKKGISAVVNDFKHAWVAIARKKRETAGLKAEHTVRRIPPAPPGLVPPTEEVQVYLDVPDEMKKLWAAGMTVVIISQREISLHPTAVMSKKFKKVRAPQESGKREKKRKKKKKKKH